MLASCTVQPVTRTQSSMMTRLNELHRRDAVDFLLVEVFDIDVLREPKLATVDVGRWTGGMAYQKSSRPSWRVVKMSFRWRQWTVSAVFWTRTANAASTSGLPVGSAPGMFLSGQTTKEVSRRIRISPGRVSQIRRGILLRGDHAFTV